MAAVAGGCGGMIGTPGKIFFIIFSKTLNQGRPNFLEKNFLKGVGVKMRGFKVRGIIEFIFKIWRGGNDIFQRPRGVNRNTPLPPP